MTTRKLLLAALLLIHAGAFAQEANKPAKEPTLEEIKPMRVVYSVQGMELVKVQKNLIYKKAGDLELQLDVYAPPDLKRGERRPAVIFVSGDAPWEILKDLKDWGVYVSYGQLAAASGFVGVTFNHRSTEKFAKIRDAASDIDDAISYARGHADALGIDPDRICLWAYSAGGPFLRTMLRDKPAFVRCIVGYYSMFGLPQGVAPEDVVREFTVANYLGQNPKNVPPLMVVRAGRDVPFINDSVDEFLREAVKQNLSIEFINYVEGTHGFDVDVNTDRTREIIKRTLEFVKKHLTGV
jgi:acetyl esterase/lipase